MKILKTLLIVPLVILLSACGKNLTKGEVVDKYTEDPAPIFINSGGVLIPINQSREYIIIVKGKKSDGEIIEEKKEVSSGEYQKIKVGQVWEEPK